MDVSATVVRLLFLLLPGGLACSLYWRLTGRTSQKDWEDLVDIGLFSLAAYGVYGLLLTAIGRVVPIERSFSAFGPFLDPSLPLDLIEILYSCVVAILLSIAAAVATNRLWLFRLAHWFGISKRVNELDVWTFVQSGTKDTEKWFTVRDDKLGLVYRGWIEAFSDSGKDREMLLRDVDVYRDGELQYKVDCIYLSRKNDEFTLEYEDVASTKEESQPADGKAHNGKKDPQSKPTKRRATRRRPSAAKSGPAEAINSEESKSGGDQRQSGVSERKEG